MLPAVLVAEALQRIPREHSAFNYLQYQHLSQSSASPRDLGLDAYAQQPTTGAFIMGQSNSWCLKRRHASSPCGNNWASVTFLGVLVGGGMCITVSLHIHVNTYVKT